MEIVNRLKQDPAARRKAATYSIRYMLVGALDCILDFIFYFCLTRGFPFWRQHYLWANFLSFMASDCAVFDIARKWVFKLPVLPEDGEEAKKMGLTRADEMTIHIHFLKYVFISFLAFVVNEAGLFSLVSLKMNDLWAKIIMGVMVGVSRFLTHKFWTFRKKTEKEKGIIKSIDEFIFLTASSDAEYKLLCKRLKDVGIEYRILDRRMRGARYLGFSECGWHIFVPASKLEESKKLLNL
ncbi:MAG: GtrA family protein [bacterium]